MCGVVRAHLRIYGRVQGVFFRANMRDVALKYGVKGWVMNREDGSVEAVLEGDEESVRKVIEWAHRGPPLAIVEKVDVKWEDYKGEFRDFRIRYY
jgi:acylphosphatase